jgi:hypothetical protein
MICLGNRHDESMLHLEKTVSKKFLSFAIKFSILSVKHEPKGAANEKFNDSFISFIYRSFG